MELSRRVESLLLSAAVAGVAVVLVAHVRAYFFLLDDFVILGEVSRRSTTAILATPLFQFYRPAGLLWLKFLRVPFAWNVPGGYAACSAVLHVGCAALVATFARQCGLTVRSALVAGTLFLLSPWGTEPYLWVSGSYDLLATLGVLATLVLGLHVVDGQRHWRAAFVTGTVTAAAALLAKEIGVLTPVLFVVAVVLVRGWTAFRSARALTFLAALVVLTSAYLLLRQRLIPDLGSGYGSLHTLLGRGNLAANAFTYVQSLFLWPLPSRFGVDRILPWVFGAAGAIAIVCVLLTRWRIALLAAVAIAGCIALVIWVPLGPRISAGNRFLYLAGAWFALMIAAGIDRLPRISRPLVVGAVVAASLLSIVYQAAIWRRASALSRATIEQMAPYAGTDRPVFVTNLPRQFVQGPYIINGLAFRYYFDRFPPIAAHEMAITWQRDANQFAFWFGEPIVGSDVRPVTLRLPIWMEGSRGLVRIDAPREGSTVTQPFTLAGWAIDEEAQAGTGIDSVRIYASPAGAREADATFLGEARYGAPRPDVAREHGAQFQSSGFTLDVSGLPPGTYTLRVHARNTRWRKSVSADVQRITVSR
jgi:hypothetical protein